MTRRRWQPVAPSGDIARCGGCPSIAVMPAPISAITQSRASTPRSRRSCSTSGSSTAPTSVPQILAKANEGALRGLLHRLLHPVPLKGLARPPRRRRARGRDHGPHRTRHRVGRDRRSQHAPEAGIGIYLARQAARPGAESRYRAVLKGTNTQKTNPANSEPQLPVRTTLLQNHWNKFPLHRTVFDWQRSRFKTLISTGQYGFFFLLETL